jgi:hypothetical protein
MKFFFIFIFLFLLIISNVAYGYNLTKTNKILISKKIKIKYIKPEILRNKFLTLDGDYDIYQLAKAITIQTHIFTYVYKGNFKKYSFYYHHFSVIKLLRILKNSKIFNYQYKNGFIELIGGKSKIFTLPIIALSNKATYKDSFKNFNSYITETIRNISMPFYRSLYDNIKQMLPKNAKIAYVPKLGMIYIINDNISNFNTIKKYLNYIKKEMSKEVLLDLTVIKLHLKSKYKNGILWHNKYGNNLALLSKYGKAQVGQIDLLLVNGETRGIFDFKKIPYLMTFKQEKINNLYIKKPVVKYIDDGFSALFTANIDRHKKLLISCEFILNSILGYSNLQSNGYTSYKVPIERSFSCPFSDFFLSGKSSLVCEDKFYSSKDEFFAILTPYEIK